ncbi:MAG TPA: IS110 family transposase [Acetobacteraceae bacterium]|nr:IS110 family transposase [Acetobacteraceae bacterium]
MSEISRIGLDTSKAVFTVHAVDAAGQPVLRVNLRRAQVIGFFRKRAATVVAMEACGGSHHWARKLSALGHDVRLIPPQYVKPYVKRGKNDRNDAEAICEAAGRPGMRFVLAKTEDQQAQALVLKVRATLVDQRTQLINALRGHATEFGVVAGKGTAKVAALLAAIAAEATIPAVGQEMLALLGEQIEHLDGRIQALEAKVAAMHKSNAISQLLATAPGIGPIIGLTFALEVDPAVFESGRHLAAWLGVTPKEHSTGGRQRMGGISRAGNERLRALLVNGAMAVIRAAERPGSTLATEWLRRLLARKPKKVAAVALANKMARMIWAMMTTGEAYRRPVAAGAARHPAVIS